LAGEKLPPAEETPSPGQPATTTAAPPPQGQPGQPDPRIAQIRQHFDRYRELVSQGKLSEAGKELEAIQSLVGK
jgi:hypothetical protein